MPYRCSEEDCDYIIMYKSDIKEHKKLHAMGKAPHTTADCKWADNIKLYDCSIPGCLYVSNRSNNVKSHEDTHNNDSKRWKSSSSHRTSIVSSTSISTSSGSNNSVVHEDMNNNEENIENQLPSSSTLPSYLNLIENTEATCSFMSVGSSKHNKYPSSTVENSSITTTRSNDSSKSPVDEVFPCPHEGCSYTAKKRGTLNKHKRSKHPKDNINNNKKKNSSTSNNKKRKMSNITWGDIPDVPLIPGSRWEIFVGIGAAVYEGTQTLESLIESTSRKMEINPSPVKRARTVATA